MSTHDDLPDYLKEADELIRGIIEVHPPTKRYVSNGREMYEEEEPLYIKLWAGFRDDLLAKLKGSKLSVFMCVALHMNEGKESFPAVSLISKETGYSDREIRYALRELQDMGLLTITHRFRSHEYTSNLYGINGAASFVSPVQPFESTGTLIEDEKVRQNAVPTAFLSSKTRVKMQIEEDTLRKHNEERRTLKEDENDQDEEKPNSFFLDGKKQSDNAIKVSTTEGGANNGHTDYRERLAIATAKGMLKGDRDVSHFAEMLRPAIASFCELFKFDPPRHHSKRKNSEYAAWVMDAEDFIDACGDQDPVSVLTEIRAEFEAHMTAKNGLAPFRVASLRSLVKTARAKAGDMRTRSTYDKSARPTTGKELFDFLNSLPVEERSQVKTAWGFVFDPARKSWSAPYEIDEKTDVIHWYDERR